MHDVVCDVITVREPQSCDMNQKSVNGVIVCLCICLPIKQL